MPLVLGMEAAGVVDEVGANVRDLQVGARVAYAGASPSLSPGAYCQLRLMNPARLIPVPDWIDDETAAAVTLKGLTAQYCSLARTLCVPARLRSFMRPPVGWA